jgi:hypothetical protein
MNLNFDAAPIDVAAALTNWAIVVGFLLCGSLFLGFVITLIMGGSQGPTAFFKSLGEGVRDLFGMSPKRVGAIWSLTIKEAVRRKALWVFGVFAVLFMFGGWFLSDTNARDELQLTVYVSFVLTAIGWLIFPVALILSCWGLPEDIRLRSLHTVVTKPVRRSEIVLGRILGFATVGTIVIAFMSLIGYVWIVRQVPDSVKSRLVARVPLYGKLGYKSREGLDADSGVNTGDINPYRSYIEGATKARAIWTFEGVTPELLQTNPDNNEDELLVENSFQAFRTVKGRIDEVLHCQYTLVNPDTEIRIPLSQIPIYEFRQNLSWIPRSLSFYNEESQQNESIDLFDDVVSDEKLVIEARCVDPGQFLGMARPDLFVRMPDRPFATSYFKSVFGIWLMMLLIVILGVTASTFVKGPVATILVFTLILIGTGFHGFMHDILTGEVRGAGLLASGIRILSHGNPNAPREGSLAESATVKELDKVTKGLLWGVSHIIPNFNTFSFKAYTAKGFDVPFKVAVLPALLTVIGFFIPCLMLGYFALKVRELEAK